MTMSLAAMKKRKPTPVKVVPQKKPNAGWPRWAWIVLGLLVIGAGTLAVFEFVIWNKVPAALVGMWDVSSGSLAGGTFEFHRDGTMRMKHKTADVLWQVTVDGKNFQMTTRSPVTGMETAQRGIIQELTPNSLVLELERAEVLKMVRRN
jgi:hypothetical protein